MPARGPYWAIEVEVGAGVGGGIGFYWARAGESYLDDDSSSPVDGWLGSIRTASMGPFVNRD